MVWAKTSTIGCGSTSWREGGFIRQFLVCNYGPAGNFRRAPIYQVGQACSRCPSGTSCSADGLCSGSVISGGAPAPLAQPPVPSPPIFTRPVNRPISIVPTSRPSPRPVPTFRPQPVSPPTFRPQPVNPPTFQVQVAPTQRPSPTIINRPTPPLQFGFVPMFDNIQRPTTLEDVNNDISVQNLLRPIPQGPPPPPITLLQPRPQRRPNCRGMFAFMCNIFG